VSQVGSFEAQSMVVSEDVTHEEIHRFWVVEVEPHSSCPGAVGVPDDRGAREVGTGEHIERAVPVH
jgi:hypothetical protein